jgi:hypothetical protein
MAGYALAYKRTQTTPTLKPCNERRPEGRITVER